MAERLEKPMPKSPVVAVLNMKGGVGKTTLTANVFKEVFRSFSAGTLLVDFDAQYNLTQLLTKRADYDRAVDAGRTILSVLTPKAPDSVFAVSENDGAPVPQASEVNFGLKYMKNAPSVQLDLVPGNFALAMMNLKEPDKLRVPAKRFASFIDTARSAYRLVVIDCNPSSSFVTRCAINAATHILVPVRPDKYSVLGVEMVTTYARDLRPHDCPKMMILLNGILDDKESRDTAHQLRAHAAFGPNVLVQEVRYSKLLHARSDFTGFATDRGGPYSHILQTNLALVARGIASQLGIA
jgi:chromosome partitioning protein